ncbi:MAG TPA: hypothetical protein VHF69_11645 [Candidatus Synoicihabitans sp.]|nr:hypothetical protein [Candidatus Synoicihabitans sp.]
MPLLEYPPRWSHVTGVRYPASTKVRRQYSDAFSVGQYDGEADRDFRTIIAALEQLKEENRQLRAQLPVAAV